MIETVNVMKKKDAAISRSKAGDCMVDGQSVNRAGLCQIASAEAPLGTHLIAGSCEMID